jgi:two-component system KDP operon response regulator KdpE
MLNRQYVTLTRKEFRLLHILAVHVGLVITHRQLIEGIWGSAASNNLQYLRTLMRKLRQKLEADPGQPKLLMSESGVGYRLERNGASATNEAVEAVDSSPRRYSCGGASR